MCEVWHALREDQYRSKHDTKFASVLFNIEITNGNISAS